MAQITWKNVNADIPDISGNYTAFSDALTKAFSGLGTGLKDFQATREGVVSNVLKSRLLRQDNTADYQNALKSGELLNGVDPSLVNSAALDMLGNQVDVLKKRDAADEAILGSQADRKLTAAKTDSEIDSLLTAAVNRDKISSDINVNNANIGETQANTDKIKADTNSVQYDDAYKQAQTTQTKTNTDIARGNFDNANTDRNDSKANAAAQLSLYASKEKDEPYQQAIKNIENSGLTPEAKLEALKAADVAYGYDRNSLSPLPPSNQSWDTLFSNPVTLRLKSNGKTVELPSSDISKASEFSGGNHHAGTITAMEMIQTQFDGNIERFTDGNSSFHKGLPYKSAHSDGRGFDVTLKPGQSYQDVTAQMKQFFLSSGLRESDFKVLNEQKNPTKYATGDHLHFEFTPKGAEKLKQFRESSTAANATNALANKANTISAQAPVIAEQGKVVTDMYRASMGLPENISLPEGVAKHSITYGGHIAKSLGFEDEAAGTRVSEYIKQLQKTVPGSSLENAAAVVNQQIVGDTRLSRYMKIGGDNFDDREFLQGEAKVKLDQLTHGKSLDQKIALEKGEQVLNAAAESAKLIQDLKIQLEEVRAKSARGIPVGNAEASIETALKKAIDQAEAQQNKAKELTNKWGSIAKSPIDEKTARTANEANAQDRNLIDDVINKSLAMPMAAPVSIPAKLLSMFN